MNEQCDVFLPTYEKKNVQKNGNKIKFVLYLNTKYNKMRKKKEEGRGDT